jgi:aryl-alcohol dehydrogenase-like predicted oxidoreductase
MAFGGDADESTSAALYKRCREAGINFFDCANVYAGGRSEQILGKLSKHERDELVLTSKVCGRVGPGANDRGLSRRHIHAQIEVSLRRLQTDRLDIYFIHNLDADTAMEETLRALDDLVHAGKILYVGVSNWAAWQISRALGVSTRESLTSFACLQPMYNVAKRQAEVEILPMAQHEGLGVISYSPVGGGLLSGKYGIGERPDHGRLIDTPTMRSLNDSSTMRAIAANTPCHSRLHGSWPMQQLRPPSSALAPLSNWSRPWQLLMLR